ncbi:MAG: hypothetical protein ACI8YI_002911, partial [Paracoccaceae bacterium]
NARRIASDFHDCGGISWAAIRCVMSGSKRVRY